jgi:hypothetical protein
MTINEGLRAVAGAFIVISVALGVWVNPWFLAFTAFVGLNLFQSAFTRTCPMVWVLRKAGCRDDIRRGDIGGAHTA